MLNMFIEIIIFFVLYNFYFKQFSDEIIEKNLLNENFLKEISFT